MILKKTYWLKEHKEKCTINHLGSAGKIEVDGIVEMFLQSKDLYGVIYENYIDDRDNKTFKSLFNKNPYGDELLVKKRMHCTCSKAYEE